MKKTVESRPVIVTGHPRSGTTILTRLCNTHPSVGVTYEFGTFLRVGARYDAYRESLRVEWNGRPVVDAATGHPRMRLWKSRLFLARFLLGLKRAGDSPVTLDRLTGLLGGILGKPVVGDKMPAYIGELDRLTQIEGLLRIVIVRDCRAVVASTLDRVRTGWKRQSWTKAVDSPEKAARTWVSTTERAERNLERIHLLRFEDLIRDPGATMDRLADHLEVERGLFDLSLLRPPGKDKIRRELSSDDMRSILEIAGPTMERLGYLR